MAHGSSAMPNPVNYQRQVTLSFFLLVTAAIVVLNIGYTGNFALPVMNHQSGRHGAIVYSIFTGRERGLLINKGLPKSSQDLNQGHRSSSETRKLFQRNISHLDATLNKNNNFSSPLSGGRNASQSTSGVTTNGNNIDRYVPTVGFFEGARIAWNYRYVFRRPESPRKCHCSGDEGESREVVVTLEMNKSRTGRYDVLFIPRDCSTAPDKQSVWETILSVAPPEQRRVYATFEGPNKLKHLTPRRFPFRNKLFHWSWTYHSKSDFPMPYGFFEHNSSKGRHVVSKNWADGKTGLVAWMSSWTHASWPRAEFVTFLQKFIQIDLFGRSHQKCPRNSKECEKTIRGYKFYLALENSCCGEYITEKFWRSLFWDIVPIVVGPNRSDYERLAPPDSFIYADDFDSVQEFADYINILDQNDEEYNKYFAWKSLGDVVVNYPPLRERIAKGAEPPGTFFYSCESVCRVTDKYNKERYVEVARYFDPHSEWWEGSCTECGEHEWIRELTG